MDAGFPDNCLAIEAPETIEVDGGYFLPTLRAQREACLLVGYQQQAALCPQAVPSPNLLGWQLPIATALLAGLLVFFLKK